MRRRSILSFGVIVATMLVLAAPALAGGWAIVILDSVPTSVRAGETLHLGFVIRQHGERPVDTDWEGHPLKPYLTIRQKDSGQSIRPAGGVVMVAVPLSAQAKGNESIRFAARKDGPVGHFVVDVKFPSAGTEGRGTTGRVQVSGACASQCPPAAWRGGRRRRGGLTA